MQTNDNVMCTLLKLFERFEKLMDEDEVYKDPAIDFNDICRMLRCSPSDLNEQLMNQFGMDGDAILERYRGKN